VDSPVVCLVTNVEVAKDDPGFQTPSKPVGGFYKKEFAQQMAQERGWKVVEDAGRGYRRVVPSPKPKKVLEIGAVQHLLDQGTTVIAGGGGGIPVINEGGQYHGVEAVIDKDLTSCLMAKQLKADGLFILTDVPNVYIGYGSPDQKALKTCTVTEMETYLRDDEFAAGSMGPKIEGALGFVKDTGNPACICALCDIEAAVSGTAGTRIIAG
jgi:carbamate kinase